MKVLATITKRWHILFSKKKHATYFHQKTIKHAFKVFYASLFIGSRLACLHCIKHFTLQIRRLHYFNMGELALLCTSIHHETLQQNISAVSRPRTILGQT